jgi:hypothetical protein
MVNLGTTTQVLHGNAAGNASFSALVAADIATSALGTGTPDGTKFLRDDRTFVTPNAGTVTSVGLALPSFITVSNSPVTSTGTLTGTLATQVANTVFAGPATGADAAPTFRAAVAADIPSLDAAKVTTGTFAIGRLASSGTCDNTTFVRGDSTCAAPSGGGTAQIIEPSSKVPVTSGLVFPNVHVGGGSGWKYFDGLGVADATTLTGDATWALAFQMPPALPTGTAKLRLRCEANLTSGALKFNPKWNTCGTATDCSSVTLNAEGTGTITYTVADAFVEVDTILDASTVTAGQTLIMNLVFEDSGTTAAAVSTCWAGIVFIP